MAAHSIPLIDRFEIYVEKTPTCWIWTGNRPDGRYGHTKYLGKTYLVHRVAYELFVGPIPEGMWVLHHCDNPPCVRPDHLFLGTPKINVIDKIYKRRGGFGRLHGRSVLTEAQVIEIREAKIAAGKTRGWRQKFMREHGISATSVTRIANGQQWIHLHAERE